MLHIFIERYTKFNPCNVSVQLSLCPLSDRFVIPILYWVLHYTLTFDAKANNCCIYKVNIYTVIFNSFSALPQFPSYILYRFRMILCYRKQGIDNATWRSSRVLTNACHSFVHSKSKIKITQVNWLSRKCVKGFVYLPVGTKLSVPECDIK